MSVDMRPCDDLVEVVFGSIFGLDRVSLVLHDEDTCDRLVKIATEARNRLAENLWESDHRPTSATPQSAAVAAPVVALGVSH